MHLHKCKVSCVTAKVIKKAVLTAKTEMKPDGFVGKRTRLQYKLLAAQGGSM